MPTRDVGKDNDEKQERGFNYPVKDPKTGLTWYRTREGLDDDDPRKHDKGKDSKQEQRKGK